MPKGIVPDCAKTVVKTAHRYESEINPQYNQFAEHYNTLIIPARPMHPKDKALVENAVNCIYRYVFPILGEQKYYSLLELNMALDRTMNLLNDRKMQKYGCSRRSLFEMYEKNTLKALPEHLFEFKKYQAPVKPTCASHIWLREDKHYYSIPYRYMHQKCSIFYTNRTVEAYCDNIRIAVHSREYGIGKSTTVIEHMPPKYCEAAKWTPERISEWAENSGESIGIVVNQIFSMAKHPFLSLRTCLGIMSLLKKFGASRLNNACKRIISYGHVGSMRQLERILIKGLDSFPDEQATFSDLPQHNNIRYTKINKEHIA